MQESILARAQTKNKFRYFLHNIRDYSTNKHRKVDDYAFGGTAGMVMLAEPIARCLDKLLAERRYDAIVYVTPDGQPFTQQTANYWSLNSENIIIICGHYKGIDQRIRNTYVTHEVSVGDYVLTSGELAAVILIDAIVRLIPGVLSDASSALEDSFQDHLLAPPAYTRPAVWRGQKVPDILLSGHQKAIMDWLNQQAEEKTRKIRPDLLSKKAL